MALTIEGLLGDEELRRHEFPAAAQSIYLAHAGVCPLPRRVIESISNYATACGEADQETVFPSEEITETRILAGRLIGAAPEEIALIGPTSLGLSMIAAGLTFPPSSNVVVYLDDYPSNVYPWMALEKKGIEVRYLRAAALGQIEVEQVLAHVDTKTALVALASCHFLSGYRLDLAAIGAALREREILFSVDGIQTVGAFPTNASCFDFLAADAHKWLLGPCGAGILYVRKGVQEKLTPSAFGWHNVRSPSFVTQTSLNFRADARKYEAGTHNLLGVAGLRAAAKLILEIGVEQIASELWRKRQLLIPLLKAKGYSILHENGTAANTGSMITFWDPSRKMEDLHSKLTQSHVISSLRTDRTGRKYIRFSPHFYNTDRELERAVELL